MKKMLLFIALVAGTLNFTIAQEAYTVNDLPDAQIVPVQTDANSQRNPNGGADCNDLTQYIPIQVGVSTSPGPTERVGTQLGRIFRDGNPTSCPSEPYPGDFNTSTTYGYSALRFYNSSLDPMCITVNTNVDGGGSPCGTNAHVMVYQSIDGTDMAPYDPTNQSVNYLGDIGSSQTGSFSVTIQPGYFEVVITNTTSVSGCDASFNIVAPSGMQSYLTCEPPPTPISNWAIVIGLLLIGTFIVVRYRTRLA